MDRSLLEKKALAELREIAAALDLSGVQRMKKANLVDLILEEAAKATGDTAAAGDPDGDDSTSADDATADTSQEPKGARSDEAGGGKQRRRNGRNSDTADGDGGPEIREGVLDLLPEGYGFLRCTGYLSGPMDVYVSQSYVRRFNLRRGDLVSGPIRATNRGSDKYPALARVETIEGLTVEQHMSSLRADFRDLTPLFPDERITLETGEGSSAAMRLVDLFAPVGKGQRGLVVAPPRAGTTTILREVATAVTANLPDAELLVLLVDERPEEVTEFERAIDGEVISSTFDRPADDHTQTAELVSERARRLVERGRDVVLLIDSITRLARAYNQTMPASGRTLAGGMDPAALYPTKRLLGAARNVEDGGSLTIIASAQVDTGSAMDEDILEELARTATMQLRLDTGLEQQRIYPAVDIHASGTRREELLLDDDTLEVVRTARRELADAGTGPALERVLATMADTGTNAEFCKAVSTSGLAKD